MILAVNKLAMLAVHVAAEPILSESFLRLLIRLLDALKRVLLRVKFRFEPRQSSFTGDHAVERENTRMTNEQRKDISPESSVLIRQPREVTDNPPLLILLHGRGAAAQTIFAMEGLIEGKFLVAAITAPLPSSIGLYEWFEPNKDVRSDEFFAEAVFANAERHAEERIGEIMKQQRVDHHNVFLMGFSQGAAMSTMIALRGRIKVKGVVAMSGFLPAIVRKWEEINPQPNFLVTHGTNDEILPTETSKKLVDFLKSQGISTEYYEYRGRHRMTLDVVRYVNTWLLRQL